MLLPQIVLPLVKLVAQAFPDKSMQRMTTATGTVFDACNHLIEVAVSTFELLNRALILSLQCVVGRT